MFRLADEVLAPWMNDGFYYPGILVALDASGATVAYFDGDYTGVDLGALRKGSLGPGLAVQVNYRGKGGYYGGVLTQRLGAAFAVAFDDGERGWCTLAQVRVRSAIVEALPAGRSNCPFCGAVLEGDPVRCGGCGAPLGRR